MTISKIIVPIRGDGKGQGVLSHATALGRRHNANIEALHCRARPDDMIPYGVVVPRALREQIRKQASSLADTEEAALRERFGEAMAAEGYEVVAPDAVIPHQLSATWIEEQGKQADLIKNHGRLADVIAVAKPDHDANLGVNTLKAALFQTGRPVLICPPGPAKSKVLGDVIAIAWNGSRQASIAVALALPLIQTASKIVVLDGGSGHPGTSAEELKRYLGMRGVKVELKPINAGEHAGRVILSEAGGVGADLLIMGAYSHSREHETMFGGATQYVVDHTEMPVLMVH